MIIEFLSFGLERVTVDGELSMKVVYMSCEEIVCKDGISVSLDQGTRSMA